MVSFTSFPTWIPVISFSSLIARTSKTILSKSGESRHPCLLLDLGGNAFSVSPLRMMLTWICPICSLLFWIRFPLCPLSGEVLLQMGVEFCQQFFSAFIEMIIWLYILQFVNMIYHIDSPILKKIYFCFIDYAKAYDCVDHNKL